MLVYILYGREALLAMEDVSLHVDAGDGGGPISVFTSSGLLSVLSTETAMRTENHMDVKDKLL